MNERKMLFIDERNIDQAFRMKRVVNPPKQLQNDPVLTKAHAYGSVLRDENGNYRMWYLAERPVKDLSKANPIDKNAYCEAYAESHDGIHWNCPELNMIPTHDEIEDCAPPAPNAFMASGQMDATGFELSGRSGPEGFCVLDRDRTPHPCARAKYTALYLSTLGDGLTGGYPGNPTGGLCLAWSDDGIHWTAYRENPVIKGWADTNNCFFYDSCQKKYILYGRPNVYAEGYNHANRIVGRAESEDMLHWSPYKTILDTDDRDADPYFFLDESRLHDYWCLHYNRPDLVDGSKHNIRGRNRQFYGICAFPYENMYLGFAQMYDIPSGGGWLELVHSYDSVVWRREAVPSVFLGPRPGHWDGVLTLGAMASPPASVGEDFWIYYTGGTASHHQGHLKMHGPKGIGIRTVPRDRLVGYRADVEQGELITVPFEKPAGLTLNAAVDGELRAALVGPSGEAISGMGFDDCIVVSGDHSRAEIRFGGAEYAGIPFDSVRLKIRCSGTVVYGLCSRY